MRDYASLYSCLLEDIGLCSQQIDSPIFSDMDNRDVARHQLAASFYKKLCPKGTNRDADNRALEKFKALNADLPTRTVRHTAMGPCDHYVLSLFKDNIRVALDPSDDSSFDLDFIREHMGPGPGSAQKADSRTAVHKLTLSRLSYYSPWALSIYRAALSSTGVWADAEMQRHLTFGEVRVEGVKIFFASKNSEISRVCGTEASVEMMLQKAFGLFLEERLATHYGIRLSVQADLNGELARVGSIDDSIATVDLSSASDCIGLALLDYVPDGFIKGFILNTRSKVAVYPDGSKGELNMVSTMGNGFTFPLQTLLFACLVRACYTAMGIPCRNSGRDFCVFGDDIIVRKNVYPLICRLLYVLGFDVNPEKSFGSGPFRESCGFDWYRGYNVRGVYIKTLENVPSIYSACNRLLRWSARHNVDLHRTIRTLLTWIRKPLRVPPSESDDAGLKVPFGLSKGGKVTKEYWFKYRYMKPSSSRVHIADDESLSSAVGFLSGWVRRPDDPDHRTPVYKGVSVNTREISGKPIRYKIATRSLPWWDYCTPTNAELSPEASAEERRRGGLTTLVGDRWESAARSTYTFVGNLD